MPWECIIEGVWKGSEALVDAMVDVQQGRRFSDHMKNPFYVLPPPTTGWIPSKTAFSVPYIYLMEKLKDTIAEGDDVADQ